VGIYYYKAINYRYIRLLFILLILNSIRKAKEVISKRKAIIYLISYSPQCHVLNLVPMVSEMQACAISHTFGTQGTQQPQKPANTTLGTENIVLSTAYRAYSPIFYISNSAVTRDISVINDKLSDSLILLILNVFTMPAMLEITLINAAKLLSISVIGGSSVKSQQCVGAVVHCPIFLHTQNYSINHLSAQEAPYETS
jgi:hypothetical protein